jgi:hypothetical protein
MKDGYAFMCSNYSEGIVEPKIKHEIIPIGTFQKEAFISVHLFSTFLTVIA